MRYSYKPSFDKTAKKLLPESKRKAEEAVRALIDFLDSRQKTVGLGLKHLRKDFWEIRTSLRIRILFKFSEDLVEFIIVGNHKDIKRYLRNL